ncbi:MobF family relaxase [Nocardioides glacieisoli]|uniref:MobF family relaxase n=1 Tax=Nocardioides glacieisoli TaxID=1168730 RepID=UPI001F5E26C7|nr:MobF family relaxase [Nocardioides glacieisoli]
MGAFRVHGGLKIYRGSAAAARNYVEADRSRADDYYLAEGTGLAQRLVAGPNLVQRRDDMDGATYERWVAGYDVESGAAKGRLRSNDKAVRFVEVTVNGPKTWSIAATLHPGIAEAYDAAQDRAAAEIISWLAQHATTRVGPRDRQVQVPVEQIEAAVVRHFTSRAGDPHRHLHLQINARVKAAGAWRGLHTVGTRDSLEAINGIGHAAVMTDPQFRAALASRGYSLDDDGGEIVELKAYAGAFSARARQIETNIDRYEAGWRADHPGEEPGPALRQSWDRRAWSEARPDKVIPVSGDQLRERWSDELDDLGFVAPSRPRHLVTVRPGELDREVIVDRALARLGSRRSAWNGADARGEVEKLIASAGVVVDGAVRRELAEDLTARVLEASSLLLGRNDVPAHVRAHTSPRVLAVERELVARIAQRADERTITVVEGAAGAGKTRRLAAKRAEVEARRGRMLIVTPTRKAAQVASAEVGTTAYSVAWLLHQHGYRWDKDGRWERAEPAPDAPRLDRRTVLVVDEAGMLNQDAARALLELADATGARVTLVGDRHQLPAVGRGGVLDLAARFAPTRLVELEGVHRFADPEYADMSLRMRTGDRPDEVFDELARRGLVVVHASEVERVAALAARASSGELVVADTREQVARINSMVHHVHARTGEDTDVLITSAGERIAVGDRVATRRNDSELGVANRERWTVVAAGPDSVEVVGDAGRRVLPAAYARRHLELAFATTAYGAQGSTVPTSHVLVGEHSGAASTYVGMTRGRERNVAHLVAETTDDARRQWAEVFGRDRADLGPTHAARRAAEDIDRYGPTAPRRPAIRPPAPVARRPEELGHPQARPAQGPGIGR